MPTDPSTLPQWKGRPVPHVARWTGEVIREPYSVGYLPGTGNPKFVYQDGNEDRRYGVLWQREGISRNGEPMYAAVNTYRQRACMDRRKCQICGNKITTPVIHWLMPIGENEGVQWLDDRALTTSAPTCDDCIPLALDLCPHLRMHGYEIYKVLEYEPWGVYGEAIDYRTRQRFQNYVSFTENYGPGFNLGLVLAKQLAVEWTKFSLDMRHEGKV